jgi:taurine--2-oxoglutarate transaminase
MSNAEITKKHSYKTWSSQRTWSPITITKAQDCHFWDDTGKKYLDFSAQLICVTLGHGNEAVKQSIIKQAEELAYMGPVFNTEVRSRTVAKLLEVVPVGIEKFFFPTSGAAANEAAIKVARHFTGKTKIVTRFNSYHGASHTALVATSDWRRYYAEKHNFAFADPNTIYVPEFNPYRPGPLGATADGHLEYYEYLFKNDPNIAAFMLEPIVGSNGVLVPPDDYLPKLRALTKKYGILLIADEVMAAWGRTGEWFCVDKWGVTPDILTTAKGVTNAAQPLGIMGTTREIADFFEDNIFCNGHTYESHPMTLAPAVAAISEFQRLNLIQRAKVEGAKLGEKLKKLKDKHPCVGDVRGTGMFWAIDLTKNRQTKEPFCTNVLKAQGVPTPIDAMGAELMKRGVFVLGHVNHFVIGPPLIITEADMDFAVQAFDEVLSIGDKLADKQ